MGFSNLTSVHAVRNYRLWEWYSFLNEQFLENNTVNKTCKNEEYTCRNEEILTLIINIFRCILRQDIAVLCQSSDRPNIFTQLRVSNDAVDIMYVKKN